MNTKTENCASEGDRKSSKTARSAKKNRRKRSAEQRPRPEILLPPELIREILEYLDSPQQLFTCCLINKSWSQQAARLLWRGSSQLDPRGDPWRSPPAYIIQRTLVNRSFYFYAGQLKHLHVNFDDVGKHAADFTGAAKKNRYRYGKIDKSYISLETLSLGPHTHGSLPFKLLDLFVGPSLKAFSLHGPQPSTSLRWDFVKQIAEQAPGLRCMHMDFVPSVASLKRAESRDMVDLLRNKLRDLRHVNIGLNSPSGSWVIDYLLGRGDLEVLGWGSIFNGKLGESIVEVHLESLRVLKLDNARLEVISTYLPRLTLLQSLWVNYGIAEDDCVKTFFQKLPDALPDLVELSLEGYGPPNPVFGVITDLVQCMPQLRIFKFREDNEHGFSLGHSQVENIMTSLRSVERLSLQAPSAPAHSSQKAAIHVNDLCRRLEYLQLELRCRQHCKCFLTNVHFDASGSGCHDYISLPRSCDSFSSPDLWRDALRYAQAHFVPLQLPPKGRLISKGRSDGNPYSMTTILNHSKVEAELRSKLLAARL